MSTKMAAPSQDPNDPVLLQQSGALERLGDHGPCMIQDAGIVPGIPAWDRLAVCANRSRDKS